MNELAKNIEPRWTRRKDERPHELIDAALQLFMEGGFAATRLDDIARQAGVSKGTLYLYFDSKEALFKAVITHGLVEKYVAAETDIAQFSGSSPDLMRTLLWRWWEEVGSTQMAGICKLMIAESHNFPELTQFYFDEVIQRGHKLIETVVLRGMKRGEFRTVNAQHSARILVAPLIMLSISRQTFGNCCAQLIDDPQGYIETHIDILLGGLTAHKV